LAATETVRESQSLYLTPRVYLADDKNVKRNDPSPWHQARGSAQQIAGLVHLAHSPLANLFKQRSKTTRRPTPANRS